MNSLRVRFLLIAAISIALVLAVSGFSMIRLFEKSLERRVEAELANYVNQIAAGLTFDQDGNLKPPADLSDLRFSQAYSGLYWQIDDITLNQQLGSRSLWDYTLPLPEDQHGVGERHQYFLPGPDNTMVMVEERELIASTPKGARPIRIATAMDYSTITNARSQFAYDMIPYLVVLGILLLLASAVQLTLGLRPLKNIREGLDAVRARESSRLHENYPNEIKPLTEAINRLLDFQDEAISRARKRAADLAHGLNTPLTVLTNDAEKLRERGETEIAEELSDLVMTMRSHIDFELALSRISQERGQRKSDGSPSKVIGEITKTLGRTPKGENLEWQISVAKDIKVAVDPDDLRELLGNIIENAVKWTDTMVAVTGRKSGSKLILTIEDNGAGLAPALIDSIVERGKRHDQKTSGTGIGMSLVQEICTIYEIGLSIENRQSSGLCVTLSIDIA